MFKNIFTRRKHKLENKELPDNYKKLDCIKGDGNQYTLLNYVINEKTTYIELKCDAPSNDIHYIGGLYAVQGGGAFLASEDKNHKLVFTYGMRWYADNAKAVWFTNIVNKPAWEYEVYTVNTLKYDNGYLSINNVYKNSWTPYKFQGTFIGDFYLLNRVSVRGNEVYLSPISISYLIIKENDVVVRNYIPVIKNDSEVGLFDTITKTFLTSLGSKPFIAGNKI